MKNEIKNSSIAVGAVMNTGDKSNRAGHLRGPVQLTMSNSVDPIMPLDMAITRCAVATQNEADKQDGANHTMGRKSIVPYAVYVGKGFVNPFLADATGFNQNDLEVLWRSFRGMFDLDRSASRGLMSLRKLVVFRHSSKFGNASAGDLFGLVSVRRKDGVAVARSFKDYEICVDTENVPGGVEYIEL